MINVEQVAKSMKIDTSKAYEALPAIATIVEKSEIIDFYESLVIKKGNTQLTQADGLKLMARIVSRLKIYEEEVDEVLAIMFDIPVDDLSKGKKIELLQKILVEKDLAEFF